MPEQFRHRWLAKIHKETVQDSASVASFDQVRGTGRNAESHARLEQSHIKGLTRFTIFSGKRLGKDRPEDWSMQCVSVSRWG